MDVGLRVLMQLDILSGYTKNDDNKYTDIDACFTILFFAFEHKIITSKTESALLEEIQASGSPHRKEAFLPHLVPESATSYRYLTSSRKSPSKNLCRG